MLQVIVKEAAKQAGALQPVNRNVLMELMDLTVAKNVGIVWKRTNAIISMEAALMGAHQDTKERDAKNRVQLAILEMTVSINVALSVEEIPRAII